MEWVGDRVRVNGVFKGGGARGVAYAGALRATADAGYWFGSVAGASAGAITAALIAAGMSPYETVEPDGKEQPSEFEAASSVGLTKVRRRLASLAAGFRDSIFTSTELVTWLEDTIGEASGLASTPDHPITFEQLYADGRPELFVVALDLHSGAPMVFSHATTPDASVAAAVASSCAIPGALPGGAATVREGPYRYLDRLVDGGAWANFPLFIYKDRLFRAWLDPSASEEQISQAAAVTTLGFLLENDLPSDEDTRPKVEAVGAPSATVDELDRGGAAASGSTPLYSIAQLLGGNPGRFAILLCFGGWLLLTGWSLPMVSRSMGAAIADRSDLAAPYATTVVAAGVLIAMLLVGGIAIGLVAFGRAVSKTAVPAVSAAMGVATGTPPWIAASADRFSGLFVPARGVSTLDFELEPAKRGVVIEAARSSVATQILTHQREDGLEPGKPPKKVIPEKPEAAPPKSDEHDKLPDWVRATGNFLLNVLLAAVVLGFFAWAIAWLERSLSRPGHGSVPWQGGTAIAVAGVLVGVLAPKPSRWLAGRPRPETRSWVKRLWNSVALLVTVAGVVGVALGLAFVVDDLTGWKTRYTVAAISAGAAGLAFLWILLGRGAWRAGKRATSRPDEYPSSWKPSQLYLAGVLCIAGGLLLGRWLNDDFADHATPARVEAIARTDGGKVATLCLLEGSGHAETRACPKADERTTGLVDTRYRVGQRVLVDHGDGTARTAEIRGGPQIWVVLLTLALVAGGVGSIVSGRKQARYRRRRDWAGG